MVAVLLCQVTAANASIPDWYADAVPRLASESDSIVLYETQSISLLRSEGNYYVYLINTKTIEVLKGTASTNSCYLTISEEPQEHRDHDGEVRIAILREPEPEAGNCRVIEPGYSAPGTQEYVQLYKEELDRQSAIQR